MKKRQQKPTVQDAKNFLANIISSVTLISDGNMQKIMDAFESVSYDKHHKIIEEGEISDYLYFISKGVVRVYYHKSNKEIIDWFAAEGDFFGNIYSHITQKPGFDIYESLEDVELLRIRYDALEKIYRESHEIESAARIIMQRYYINYVERVHRIKALSSEEKYHLFMTNHASFMNRIQLKYVANYLGMTSETLSRIRSKYDKQLLKSKK